MSTLFYRLWKIRHSMEEELAQNQSASSQMRLKWTRNQMDFWLSVLTTSMLFCFKVNKIGITERLLKETRSLPSQTLVWVPPSYQDSP
jgi:hypothetical protein